MAQGKPHSKLAAGKGRQMALVANVARRGSELAVARVHSLREIEECRGVDGGHGTAMGESHGDLRGRDVLREFGDGQEIEAAPGEKCCVNGAAELLDGSANHGESVLGGVSQMAPGLIGETNLEAIAGHWGLDSGGARGLGM